MFDIGVADRASVFYPARGADWINPPALMEFAGEDLICSTSSKDSNSFRFASQRSNLSRHHQHIYLRNLSAIHLLFGFIGLLRGPAT